MSCPDPDRGSDRAAATLALCALLALALSACDLSGDDLSCPDPCPLLTRCDLGEGRCVIPDDYPVAAVNRAPSLALDPDGRAIIAAYAEDEADAVLGVWDEDAARFRFQAIDRRGQVGSHISLALSAEGVPSVLYFDANQLLLRYAHYDPDTLSWLIEEVDSSSPHVGLYPHLVIDPDGTAHATYRDEYNRALRYAVRQRGIWRVEYVDVGKDTDLLPEEACPTTQRQRMRLGVGVNPHLVLQGTTPVIAYHDADCGTLRLARRTSSGWTREVLVGRALTAALPSPGLPVGVGRANAVALNPLGDIIVAFFDADAGELKVAFTTGGMSSEPLIEVVDNGLRALPDAPPEKHLVGQHLSLAFNPDGTLAVAHMDASSLQVLRSARLSPGTWQTVALPPEVAGEGFSTRLVIDPDATLHVISANAIRSSLLSVPLRYTRVTP
jgi:hypothetical protein